MPLLSKLDRLQAHGLLRTTGFFNRKGRVEPRAYNLTRARSLRRRTECEEDLYVSVLGQRRWRLE
jgi:hypothetical protein